MTDETEIIDAETTETSLAVYAGEANVPAPATFEEGVMLMPVPQMAAALQEYDNRRNALREWIRQHFVEGVHFGFPPGCEPRRNNQGQVVHKGTVIEPWQWVHKPGLYKAGAELVIGLFRVVPRYSSDIDAWKMSGEIPGLLFRRCELWSPKGDKKLGEGTGAYKMGKGMLDENGAVKQADKRASVAAVLNTFQISDLFTQDLEPAAEPKPKPVPAADAPTVKSRAERQTDGPPDLRDEVIALYKLWRVQFNDGGEDYKRFAAWAAESAGTDRDLNKLENWSLDAVTLCREALQ